MLGFKKKKEAKMFDIMLELFKWDQDVFLQNIFISLDTSTLRRCREVSKLWREFIDRRVWGCERLRSGLIVRLWKDFQPVQRKLIVGGSVTSIACDDQIIVCGYTDGASQVFSDDTGDCIDTLSDDTGDCIDTLIGKQEDIHYSSSKVTVGKDIIVKIAYGSDQSGRVGKCSVEIWRKTCFVKIYESVLDNQQDCVHLQVHGYEVFIRTGKKLSKVTMSLESSKALTIVQENLNDVKDLPKGDFLTNGIYCIARTKHDIYFYKFGFETEVRNVSMEKNIVNLSMKDQHVLILQDFQFSVLNLNTKEIQLKGQSSVQLISTSSNHHVVLILDANNTINLFTWSDLTNPNLSTCLPIKSLSLPLPTSSYTSPCISLSQTTLITALAGSNHIVCYQLWRGSPPLLEDVAEEEKLYQLKNQTFLERKKSGAGIRNL